MPRRALGYVLLAALALPVAGSEIQVRLHGNLVDVLATAAPLQEILAQLSRQTGMKVVYEGAVPRVPLTVSLPQRTPIEAVLGLFEGIGLNYALKTDPGGTRIDTLIVAGLASQGSSGGRPAPTAPAPSVPAFRPPPPVPEEAEEEEQAEDKSEEEQKQAPEAAPTPVPPFTFSEPIPGPGRPGSPFGSAQVAPLVLPTPPTAPAAPAQGGAPGAAPSPAPTPEAKPPA